MKNVVTFVHNNKKTQENSSSVSAEFTPGHNGAGEGASAGEKTRWEVDDDATVEVVEDGSGREEREGLPRLELDEWKKID